MRKRLLAPLVGVCLVATMALFAGSASAALFGVSVLKDCVTPVNVGDAYACEFEISNTVQTSQNTVTVSLLRDQVLSAVSPPDLVVPINSSTPGLILAGGATCDATKCTIPFGGSLTTSFISHYTVQVADFPLLADRGTFTWNNSCDVVSAGCSTLDSQGQATASATVNPLSTTTVTAIHNAAHQVVTAVPVGSTVHDFVRVANVLPNVPIPTGNVNVDWFLNGDCSGAPVASSGSLGPLDASGQFDATAFSFTVNTPGMRAFRASYLGSGAYLPSTGACEPLQVVDANIQISPLQATNPVGTNHTLTGHVNVNSGSGFVNAPDGTTINFSILSGPGSFVGGVSSCNTTGGTGSCTVQITSAVTGTTVVRASTNVTVGGVSLTRATGDANVGDSADAQKLWQFRDANIQISPLTATNPVGTNHTLTGHVNVNSGSGFVNAPDGTTINFSIASGPGSFVGGVSSCNTTGGTGSCSVQITSATPGTTVVKAATDVTVLGVVLHRETGDANAGDSANAQKTWVDANIQITPATATNPLNTNSHADRARERERGYGFVNAPDGTLITFTIQSGPGSFVGGVNTCNTAGGTGSCTVQITSAVAGTTVVRASTNVTVGGISLSRATGDANVGDSADAQKTWEGGGQGCTPGYWKQSQHFDSWVGTGYTPNQTVGSVFTNSGVPTQTLVQALGGGGGSSIQGAKTILLRAAVAALLNAGSSGVNYQFTTAQIIAATNAALASNDRATILALAADLDAANNAGCPLN